MSNLRPNAFYSALALPMGTFSGRKLRKSLTRKKSIKCIKRQRVELSTAEKICSAIIVSAVHIAIIALLWRFMMLSLSYAAVNDFDDNSLVTILSSGVFDAQAGTNAAATSFFTRVAETIFAIALPFMSAFAITMTTISLISSVIYLVKPDTFDEIDRLHQDRKDKHKVGDLIEHAKSVGFRDFVLSICPNIKAYAFADATEVGESGTPTMQDFLKNIPKYIMIFAFCIVINDRAMLDFIMNGAKVGALLFERITYDYDYADSVNQWLDEGTDYKPISWDTKTQDGANKMKLYKTIYKALKRQCTADEDLTTDAKTRMGSALEKEIQEGSIFNGVAWDKDIFTVNAEYSNSGQATSVEGIYIVPVNRFLASDMGSIIVSIHTEDKLKHYSKYSVTTYGQAWGTDGLSFDLNKMADMTAISGDKSYTGNFTYSVDYKDASGNAKNFTGNGTISGNTISLTKPSDASEIESTRISLQNAKYTTTSTNGNSTTKALNPKSPITWSKPVNGSGTSN